MRIWSPSEWNSPRQAAGHLSAAWSQAAQAHAWCAYDFLCTSLLRNESYGLRLSMQSIHLPTTPHSTTSSSKMETRGTTPGHSYSWLFLLPLLSICSGERILIYVRVLSLFPSQSLQNHNLRWSLESAVPLVVEPLLAQISFYGISDTIPGGNSYRRPHDSFFSVPCRSYITSSRIGLCG